MRTRSDDLSDPARVEDDGSSRSDARDADLRKLRRRAVALSRSRNHATRLLLELGVHIAIMFAGIAIVVISSDVAILAFGLLVSTAGALGVGSNSHTSSHNATSRSARLNRFLTYFGYTFLLGLSATYWKEKHVVLHHRFPNVFGVDGDIDLLPWLALTDREMRDASIAAKKYYRYQWIACPVLLPFNGLNMLRAGYTYLAKALCDPSLRSSQHWHDLLALALHLVFWLFLPALFFSVYSVALLYLVRVALLGIAIFLVLAPAHLPRDASIISRQKHSADRIGAQIFTTINFQVGRIGAFLCSGLNFQIEHHLFPSLPPSVYPELSADVREFCRVHGYPYRCLSWPVALKRAFGAFVRPRPVE